MFDTPSMLHAKKPAYTTHAQTPAVSMRARSMRARHEAQCPLSTDSLPGRPLLRAVDARMVCYAGHAAQQRARLRHCPSRTQRGHLIVIATFRHT